jgi:hypothetical protein
MEGIPGENVSADKAEDEREKYAPGEDLGKGLEIEAISPVLPPQESNEQKTVIQMQDAEMQKKKHAAEIGMEGEIEGRSDEQAYPAYYDALYILKPHESNNKQSDKDEPDQKQADPETPLKPSPQKQSIPRVRTLECVKSGCPMGDRWLFNLFLVIFILLFIIFALGYNPLCFIGAALFYLVYWIDCCCAKTPNFLGNIMKDSKTLKKMEKLKKVGPTTNWYMNCYHYETEHYTTTDANGNTQHNSREVRRDTNSAEEKLEHGDWSDSSPELECLERVKISRIYSGVVLAFADPDLETAFIEKRNKFIAANNTDTHYAFTEKHSIEGLDPFILSFHGGKTDFLQSASRSKYYGYCFIFLGWYLRFYLFKHSDRIDYQFIKVIHSLQIIQNSS